MLDQTSQWYKLQYPECFSNEEQRSVQKLFADFVERNIMPVRHKIDDDLTHDEIITPILKKFQVDLGCQADMIPEDCGGNEFLRLGMVAAALKSEQLSCGDWGINLHTSSPPPQSGLHICHGVRENKDWTPYVVLPTTKGNILQTPLPGGKSPGEEGRMTHYLFHHFHVSS